MAKSYDIDLKVTGVPSMPYFRIENDDKNYILNGWITAFLKVFI